MFRKVVVVDNTGMNQWAKDRLRALSETAEFYDDFPTDPAVIRQRIGNADCLMVSYNTRITRARLLKTARSCATSACAALFTARKAPT